MLSLIIPSFAIPVGLAFLGNILGLLLTVKGFFYATPFSMLIYSMGSTNITGEINLPVVIITCILYIFISFAISFPLSSSSLSEKQGQLIAATILLFLSKIVWFLNISIGRKGISEI